MCVYLKGLAAFFMAAVRTKPRFVARRPNEASGGRLESDSWNNKVFVISRSQSYGSTDFVHPPTQTQTLSWTNYKITTSIASLRCCVSITLHTLPHLVWLLHHHFHGLRPPVQENQLTEWLGFSYQRLKDDDDSWSAQLQFSFILTWTDGIIRRGRVRTFERVKSF